jgi:hypothetical protein
MFFYKKLLLMEKQVIEINWIKMEVDMRHVKVVDKYWIWDNVKVLIQEYSDTYKTYIWCICWFDNFEGRPNINIAYFDIWYSSVDVKFIDYNKDTEKVQIAPLWEYDISIKKSEVLDKFESEIDKKKIEIKEIERKVQYFEKHFGRYFENPKK